MSKANIIAISQAVEAVEALNEVTVRNAKIAEEYVSQMEELGMSRKKGPINRISESIVLDEEALVEVKEAAKEVDVKKAEKAVKKASTATVKAETYSREIEQQSLADVAVASVVVFIEKTSGMGKEAKDLVEKIEELYISENLITPIYGQAKELSTVIVNAVNGMEIFLEKAHRGASVPDAEVSQAALEEVERLYTENCNRLEHLKGYYEQIKNIVINN